MSVFHSPLNFRDYLDRLQLAWFDRAYLADIEWHPCWQHLCSSCRFYRVPGTRIIVHVRELSRMEIIR